MEQISSFLQTAFLLLSNSDNLLYAILGSSLLVAKMVDLGLFFRNILSKSKPKPLFVPVIKTVNAFVLSISCHNKNSLKYLL